MCLRFTYIPKSRKCIDFVTCIFARLTFFVFLYFQEHIVIETRPERRFSKAIDDLPLLLAGSFVNTFTFNLEYKSQTTFLIRFNQLYRTRIHFWDTSTSEWGSVNRKTKYRIIIYFPNLEFFTWDIISHQPRRFFC